MQLRALPDAMELGPVSTEFLATHQAVIRRVIIPTMPGKRGSYELSSLYSQQQFMQHVTYIYLLSRFREKTLNSCRLMYVGNSAGI